MKSPYVYFGGKSKVAPEVWRRLGQCDTYIEPFFGSGAVLLENPHWEKTVETVNDLNHYIANFWRALKAAPDQVAEHCDYPVVETDLHARHAWLVNEGRAIIERCASDPDFYDAKVAGWWVWGMALWIGRGWCAGNGGWTAEHLAAAEELQTFDLHEINRQRPHLRDSGQGVNRQLPHLGDSGQGVNRQRPHLRSGKGINRKNGQLYEYLNQLARRMRNVRVCCGDWLRVLQPAVTWAGEEGTQQQTCGIFLDPPYSSEAGRDMNIYTHDDGDVAHAVREWCIANESNALMRIGLCGYAGEGHDELAARGWSKFSWKSDGGYASASANETRGKVNRHRETIWFSPHCLKETQSKFELT